MKTGKIRGLLGLARRARGLLIGSRETRAGLRRGDVRLVLLAGDGSSRDRERLLRVAEDEGVPARTLATREELGAWVGCGPVSVVGLTEPNLASEIRARVDGDGEESGPERAPRKDGGQER